MILSTYPVEFLHSPGPHLSFMSQKKLGINQSKHPHCSQMGHTRVPIISCCNATKSLFTQVRISFNAEKKEDLKNYLSDITHNPA